MPEYRVIREVEIVADDEDAAMVAVVEDGDGLEVACYVERQR